MNFLLEYYKNIPHNEISDLRNSIENFITLLVRDRKLGFDVYQKLNIEKIEDYARGILS